jgi:hypothetical protein
VADDQASIPPEQEREMHELYDIHDSGPETARAALWTRILVVSGIVFSVVVAILLLATVLIVRQTQVDNAQRAEDTKELAEQIKSCTTPAGACYKRGERRTAAAVGAIAAVNKRSAAAAASCARVSTEYATILRCVNRTLGVGRRTPR